MIDLLRQAAKSKDYLFGSLLIKEYESQRLYCEYPWNQNLRESNAYLVPGREFLTKWKYVFMVRKTTNNLLFYFNSSRSPKIRST